MTRNPRRLALAILFSFGLLVVGPQVAAGPTATDALETPSDGGTQSAAAVAATRTIPRVELVSRLALYLIDRLLPNVGQYCDGACLEGKKPQDNPIELVADDYQGDIPDDFGIAHP